MITPPMYLLKVAILYHSSYMVYSLIPERLEERGRVGAGGGGGLDWYTCTLSTAL